MKIIVVFFLCTITRLVFAQVITSDPLFPSDQSPVVIDFYSDEGTAGLSGYQGDVYAHTGVITDKSTFSYDWKYVKTSWGENTPETQLTLIAPNHYQLSINPTIREYYGVPDDEQILKMAFVFRNADASLEGKGDGGSDLFIELNQGFALNIISPTSRYQFYDAQDSIKVSFVTSEKALFQYYIDGSLELSLDTNTYTLYHQVLSDQEVHSLKVLAINNADTLSFNHDYIVSPLTKDLSLPESVDLGINYLEGDSAVTLVLAAPNKSNAFLLGDFNDWSLKGAHQMQRDQNYLWITLEELEKRKEYRFQYLIDGEILIADPYTEKIISRFDDAQIRNENRYPNLDSYPADDTNFEISVLQTSKPNYEWQDTSFKKPEKEDLVIYELLVRDFTDKRTFQAVIDKLDYLDSLGINALELMPIMEFEGNLSWGYNPAFMMAVDKYYGTEQELKKLIDECHRRGIAVIFDIVLNHHFGRSSLVRLYNTGDYGAPTVDNPWLNRTAKHDYNVGYDFNHESEWTKSYMDRIVAYWIEEFNIDGYRFDLSKGLTQKNTLGDVTEWGKYDASRVAILKHIADVVWEADSDAYVILEHFSENPEESELADYGMMLWGNLRGSFFNTAMGIASDLKWGYYKQRGWNQNAIIGYMESHDEERILYEVGERSQESFETQINRLIQNTLFFFAIPGPKMIWQFGEFGYDLELNNDRLGVKPTKWEYLENESRQKLLKAYQAMINLKTQTNYLDDKYFDWQPSGDIKWITYQHPDIDIVIYGNFTRQDQETSRYFTETGTWYNYLTGQTISVDDLNEKVTLPPASFGIYSNQPIDNYIEDMMGDYLTFASKKNSDNDYFFPNPAINFIQLDQAAGWAKYEIHNLTGKSIKSGTLENNMIDITDLSQGVYLINFENKVKKSVTKLIKN
ncbi:MAG: hypothetical protein CMB82_08080 [Flammeovirgaceae bacterium]|nr:hypothetical protein [Flammeovirgaceae bacterium]